jgi:DnaJ-class molecular chaperone
VHPANEEIHIVVPPGIRSGEVIRMSAKGEAVPGGGPGDLYVKVRVLTHEKFHRENDDLHMDLHIPLSEALVGGDREIETLEGKTAIKIPAGAQTGDLLRIRSKGFPRGEGTERGDLLLEVHIDMPRRVTKRIKEIAEEMKKEGF